MGSPPIPGGLLLIHESTKMSFNEKTSSFFPANFLLQMQTQHEDQDNNLATSVAPMHYLSTPGSCTNPHEYYGVANFLGKRSMSFQGLEAYEDMNREDDLSDDCTQVEEKKRRLNMEQVKTLEKNFELGNKLEPERKMQLARALGLQPRQIAIWFQNKRARWKTKQLEKDYDVLKKQFKAVKSENDALLAQNKKLQAEIMTLRGRETQKPINLNKETEVSSSNRSENENCNHDINVNTPRPPPVVSSTLATTHQNMSFFQPTRPLTQNLHNPSRSELQCPKLEHGVHEESFCNMFSGLDDQSGFWTAWHDHQNFH